MVEAVALIPSGLLVVNPSYENLVGTDRVDVGVSHHFWRDYWWKPRRICFVGAIAAMKGQLQKRTDATALACCTCAAFRDDDPDIFYCTLQHESFPALCDEYRQGAQLADASTEWTVPDDL